MLKEFPSYFALESKHFFDIEFFHFQTQKKIWRQNNENRNSKKKKEK